MHPPWIGLAHKADMDGLLDQLDFAPDFVEIPFERAIHDPSSLELATAPPLVVHSASMSLAGCVAPHQILVEQLVDLARRTKTPWIGEHLAFLTAPNRELADNYDGELSAGYTIAPAFNADVLELVVENHARVQDKLPVPVILENPPVYFTMPGTDRDPFQFTYDLCQASGIDLLLDLTHLVISSENLNIDPWQALQTIPLERVVEVHISGLSRRDGVVWDDHNAPAPDIVFELLSLTLKNGSPRAVTLEFNWSPTFPLHLLTEMIDRVQLAVTSAA